MAKKGRWEREDKLLDYIAAHQKEITRYLIVVLIGEVWQWLLGRVIYPLVPPMQTYSTAFTFLLWALPYFLACKLWVWQQTGDDRFVWMMQGMKFIMSIIVIALLRGVLFSLLKGLSDRPTFVNMLGILFSEALYFIAMLKVVLKPVKRRL